MALEDILERIAVSIESIEKKLDAPATKAPPKKKAAKKKAEEKAPEPASDRLPVSATGSTVTAEAQDSEQLTNTGTVEEQTTTNPGNDPENSPRILPTNGDELKGYVFERMPGLAPATITEIRNAVQEFGVSSVAQIDVLRIPEFIDKFDAILAKAGK